ncbi:MAG: dienelactone hydrolase family protein [Acidobacteriia bacterium]|nr:dienelactone hydrolase family protein [Terriglobia bacterium]
MWKLLCIAACLPAFSQDWARERLDKSTRHQEWLYLKHDGRTVDTFIVYPEVSQKTPVILIIHDGQGLTEWAQSLADAVAEAGYIALAPDLLSGMGPKGGGSIDFAPGTVAQGIAKLPPEQIAAYLDAVADYARKIPAANGKVAIAGFGWGASQALRFAASHADLAAVYLFGAQERPPSTPSVFDFPGPADFMRLGDAPNASGPAKKARDDAWEQWKKLLAKL